MDTSGQEQNVQGNTAENPQETSVLQELNQHAVKNLHQAGRHPLTIVFAGVLTVYLILSLVMYFHCEDPVLFYLKIPYVVVCLGLWITVILMNLEKKSTLSFRLMRLFLLIPAICAFIIPLLVLGIIVGAMLVQHFDVSGMYTVAVMLALIFLDAVFAYWHSLRQVPSDAIAVLKGKKSTVHGGYYPMVVLLVMAAARLAVTFQSDRVVEKFTEAAVWIQELVYSQLAVSSDTETFISNVSTFLVSTTDQVIEHTNNALTMMSGVDGMHIAVGLLCAAVDLLLIGMLMKIRMTNWEA